MFLSEFWDVVLPSFSDRSTFLTMKKKYAHDHEIRQELKRKYAHDHEIAALKNLLPGEGDPNAAGVAASQDPFEHVAIESSCGNLDQFSTFHGGLAFSHSTTCPFAIVQEPRHIEYILVYLRYLSISRIYLLSLRVLLRLKPPKA